MSTIPFWLLRSLSARPWLLHKGIRTFSLPVNACRSVVSTGRTTQAQGYRPGLVGPVLVGSRLPWRCLVRKPSGRDVTILVPRYLNPNLDPALAPSLVGDLVALPSGFAPRLNLGSASP